MSEQASFDVPALWAQADQLLADAAVVGREMGLKGTEAEGMAMTALLLAYCMGVAKSVEGNPILLPAAARTVHSSVNVTLPTCFNRYLRVKAS